MTLKDIVALRLPLRGFLSIFVACFALSLQSVAAQDTVGSTMEWVRMQQDTYPSTRPGGRTSDTADALCMKNKRGGEIVLAPIVDQEKGFVALSTDPDGTLMTGQWTPFRETQAIVIWTHIDRFTNQTQRLNVVYDLTKFTKCKL